MLNYFYFFTQFKNKILNKQTNFQNIIFFKNIIFFYFWLFVIFYLFYIFINATFYISWFNNNFFWTMNNSKLFFLITGCSIIYLFFYNVYFKIKPKIFCIFFIIATLIIIFFVNFIFLQTNFLLLLLLLEISTIALFLFLINELNIFYQKNFKKFILLKFIKLFFFQFWISFLTSIVLILILANFYLLYGSLSYWYFNYCVVFNFQQFNTSLFYILLLAFFLKFGLAPAHFLKASLYNTLSYSLIFIFTFVDRQTKMSGKNRYKSIYYCALGRRLHLRTIQGISCKDWCHTHTILNLYALNQFYDWMCTCVCSVSNSIYFEAFTLQSLTFHFLLGICF